MHRAACHEHRHCPPTMQCALPVNSGVSTLLHSNGMGFRCSKACCQACPALTLPPPSAVHSLHPCLPQALQASVKELNVHAGMRIRAPNGCRG